jgi:hypothetical protein
MDRRQVVVKRAEGFTIPESEHARAEHAFVVREARWGLSPREVHRVGAGWIATSAAVPGLEGNGWTRRDAVSSLDDALDELAGVVTGERRKRTRYEKLCVDAVKLLAAAEDVVGHRDVTRLARSLALAAQWANDYVADARVRKPARC